MNAAKSNQFLEKLASLVEEYDAEFSYTRDDDGIHISINGDYIHGDEIYVGWIQGKTGSESLRKAKSALLVIK